ncbi:hypothetical protein BGZ99_004596 [Dissophora globulifera]|uniref:Uncharacterized protein n=1 Tax=Dissophora globulifera TaxID=979702 RepID=A0A9P6RTR1_9FUNG|nr:hypothetical protein BGZ99_004596 [Dissophora globulifera]
MSRSNNANTNEGIGIEVLYGNVSKNKDYLVLETLRAPPLDSRNDSDVSTRASRAGRKPISFAIRRPTRSLTTVSSRDSTDSDMEISSGPDPDDDPYPVRTRNHRQ